MRKGLSGVCPCGHPLIVSEWNTKSKHKQRSTCRGCGRTELQVSDIETVLSPSAIIQPKKSRYQERDHHLKYHAQVKKDQKKDQKLKQELDVIKGWKPVK